MTKTDLIAQLTFELYEAKSRLELIYKLTEDASEEISLIEINNICSCRKAYEDANE